jgi:hypothetical protein
MNYNKRVYKLRKNSYNSLSYYARILLDAIKEAEPFEQGVMGRKTVPEMVC